MSQALLNKVAIVTGAGSGIGKAIAERFLTEGAKIVVFCRTRSSLEELVAQAPARVLVAVGDVTSLADLGRLAAATTRRFCEIYVLVFSYGIARIAPIVETTEELMDEQFRVNFFGALNTFRECLPFLSQGAAVIFMTAQLTDSGFLGLGGFNASKAAVGTLASELSPRGIRVNSLAPGPTDTPMWNNTGLSKKRAEQMLAAMKKRLSAGRLASPQSVAESALFLATDAARNVIGQELVVDGGFSIR